MIYKHTTECYSCSSILYNVNSPHLLNKLHRKPLDRSAPSCWGALVAQRNQRDLAFAIVQRRGTRLENSS